MSSNARSPLVTITYRYRETDSEYLPMSITEHIVAALDDIGEIRWAFKATPRQRRFVTTSGVLTIAVDHAPDEGPTA